MNDHNLISSQIRSFLMKQFPAARKQSLDDNISLLQSGIIDSQGVLELVTFLEKTFSIQLADEELTPENFASIGQLAAFVQDKRQAVAMVAE